MSLALVKRLKIYKNRFPLALSSMKQLLSLISLLILLSCGSQQENKKVANAKNEVLVFGTIHSGHYTREEFDIEVLTRLIKAIKPDLILAEIPPDRFPTAMKEFLETDTIKEPRVIRFPEYIDVIFPLMKEMDFEIVPTAGWTKPMADARSKKLKDISQDPDRQEDWLRYTNAGKKSDSLMELSGRR